MIIRREADALVLITQPDHARLAAETIERWCTDGFARHPRRDVILLAAREHDNGWIEEDAETHVGDDGMPLDFVTVPPVVRHRLWPRAVDRVAAVHPYAAAIIAQHALTVYVQMRAERTWDDFFSTMAERRARLLERCGGEAVRTIDADYLFVNAADRLSLAFCTGWTQPLQSGGHRITLKGYTVEVTPDPFAGARVPLRIAARRIPIRRYASSADLRRAFEAAPVDYLEGSATGDARG